MGQVGHCLQLNPSRVVFHVNNWDAPIGNEFLVLRENQKKTLGVLFQSSGVTSP